MTCDDASRMAEKWLTGSLGPAWVPSRIGSLASLLLEVDGAARSDALAFSTTGFTERVTGLRRLLAKTDACLRGHIIGVNCHGPVLDPGTQAALKKELHSTEV